APSSTGEDAHGEKIRNNKFKGYAEGLHVPHPIFVKHVDRIVNGSEWALNHVIWRVLRTNGVVTSYAKDWIRELVPEIQSIVFSRNYELILSSGKHYVGSLERRACLDSLAVLTILLRLAQESADTELAWTFAIAIYRVLLIIGPELDEQKIADRLFDVYVERIFSQLGYNNTTPDFENFHYLRTSYILDQLSERLRLVHGRKINKKMPSYFAIRVLNGQDLGLKDLFEFPVAT
ncbi:MAG: hypothetical protein RIR18_1891, partial [Pseudomonadota bacterium]